MLPADRDQVTLSVSIVLYRPGLDGLRVTCASLAQAIGEARRSGALARAVIHIVDNGGVAGDGESSAIDSLLREQFGATTDVEYRLSRGHGNVGYGRGHNLAIAESSATYHLILNPDVYLEPDALQRALQFLGAHQSVGLLTPEVRGPDGERQYLCRERPSVFTLLLRGFGPEWMKRLFAARLARYELRDRPPTGVSMDIEIASGCFMLARRDALQAIGGFHPGYFLYFEDYDLSLEIGKRSRIAYVDTVRIVHWGGGVPNKGATHIAHYVRSALLYFTRQGWKLL